MAHQGLIAASLALLLGACSAPVEQPKAPLPAASGVAPSWVLPSFSAEKWGDFSSRRFGLELPLPEGTSWVIDDHTGSWLEARHATTGSTLLVQASRADGIATRARCEEDARIRRKLPDKEGADRVEQRSIDVPAGFDTRVEVGVITKVPGARGATSSSNVIRGFVLAFGGRAHRCFAYVFTTSAEGPGAERAVGERLATMVQGSLAKVRLRNDLAPELPREGLPSEPPGAPPPR